MILGKEPLIQGTSPSLVSSTEGHRVLATSYPGLITNSVQEALLAEDLSLRLITHKP